ncbi:hypothetical protein BV581_21645, partial [Stutzerimonas stutzeri]
IGGKPLPKIGPLNVEGTTATASFESQTRIAESQFHYTLDQGSWKERNWTSIDASLVGNSVVVELPDKRPLVCFITVKDDRGAVVSTEHVELTTN